MIFRYEWIPTSWGQCVSTVGPDTQSPVTCGGGVQQRRVFCARALDRAPQPDSLCAHVQPPPIYQRYSTLARPSCDDDDYEDYDDGDDDNDDDDEYYDEDDDFDNHDE
ncbi:Thrombospondin type-1 (TSP1) repeat [Trinorchestia longiramus]|nr:Thrombospondin type-1 (TSP1) repeat [Trinorchestia longiramus]